VAVDVDGGSSATAARGPSGLGPLVVLEIPAAPGFVGVARSVVYATAATVPGIDDERLDDLRIAVSEACTNAVEAHQTHAPDDKVVVRLDIDDARLQVQIEDVGAGFDPADVPVRPAPGQPGHLDAERGWGMLLIKALVDAAEFTSSDTGTAVTLTMERLDD
jgi:serine/threonine-protein kinase RsbW